MNYIPGNAVTAMMQNKINNETVARVEEEMHLNDPILVRFGLYIKDLLHGDLGTSFVMNQPVFNLIKNAFPNNDKAGIIGNRICMDFRNTDRNYKCFKEKYMSG